MSNISDQIDNLAQSAAFELEKAKSQTQAIEKSHSLLRDFIFQSVTNIKSVDDEKQKLEILGNTLKEINKYTDQEVQKYMCNLASLTGRIQGLRQALELVKIQEASEPNQGEHE